MSLYLMCIYGHVGEESEFRRAWAKTGKKLDMGKACIRFKKLEDLAIDVIGETIKRIPANKYIDFYVKSLAARGLDPSGKKMSGSAKAPPRKAAPKPATAPAAGKAKTAVKSAAAGKRSKARASID
jgi:hypothetical protein